MQITLRVTKERLENILSMDELIGLQEGNIKLIKAALSKFMIDPATDTWYPVEVIDTDDDFEIVPSPDALARIGKLTPAKLTELAKGFTTDMQDKAVPPPSARA